MCPSTFTRPGGLVRNAHSIGSVAQTETNIESARIMAAKSLAQCNEPKCASPSPLIKAVQMLAHSSIDRLQGPPLNLLIGRIRDHLTFCAALAEVPKLGQLFLSQLLDSDIAVLSRTGAD